MPFTFLVGFVGGNVCVSDMSFHTTAASPAVPADITAATICQGIVVVIGNTNASSAFHRVAHHRRRRRRQGLRRR